MIIVEALFGTLFINSALLNAIERNSCEGIDGKNICDVVHIGKLFVLKASKALGTKNISRRTKNCTYIR